MSRCSLASANRVSLRAIALLSLLLLLLIGATVTGYQVWRRSRTLPLPAAADIQRVDFGINLGATSTIWYKLPLLEGRALVEMFRDSVVMPSTPQKSHVVAKIPPHEYSVLVFDKKGKQYSFLFRAYSNDVYVLGSWAEHSFYVFPENRIPRLGKLVQGLLSSKQVAGGRYCYLPGEDDRSHYSRICSLILSGNSKNGGNGGGNGVAP